MADAAPAAPDDLEQTYRQLLQQTLAPPAAPAPQGPTASSHEGRGFLSLLGEALGGGQEYGSAEEREQGGLRALGAMGQRMLAASDYSYQPHTLGAIIGQGMGGASESLAGTQSVSAARAAALQDYQKQQQEMQLARVKEAVPILTQLQTLRQAAEARRLALGGPPGTTPGTTPGTSLAELTGDKAHDLPLIAQRESGGDPTALNYVAKADPTAYDRGATASGKYQIVNSTWKEGMQLAGIDASKFATARDAPESVQDQVASALFDKYGNKPWQKGSKDWVKDESGRYQLATVRPSAGSPGAPKPTPAAPVAATPKTPPPASTPPAQTAFVPGGSLPYGAPGPAPTAPPAPLVPPVAAAPRTSTTLRGTGTPATPQLPGGNLQLSEGEPVPAPYQIAGTDTGPPSSSFGILGQAARAAEEGGPPPTPPAVAAPQASPAATPPAATAPPIESFVYQRGALPATIQSRIDHPAQFVSPDLTTALQVAAASGDISKMAAAKAAVGAAADAVRAKALEEGEAYHTNERNKQQEFRQKQIDNQQAVTLKQQELDSALRVKQEEGNQQRLSSTQAADIARQEKRMEALDTAGGASRDSLNDLDMLRALSSSIGSVSPWTQLEVGGRKVQDWMTRFQLGTPESLAQMGNQQAYEAVVNKIIVGLRSGVSMGNLSDKDLNFIRDQAPSLMQDPRTRGNIIGFLEQVYQRKLDYAQTVSKYYRPGTVSVADAEAKADKELGPLLKQLPAVADLRPLLQRFPPGDPDAPRKARDLWIYHNIKPGSFYKSPSGKLVPYNPPPGWQPDGAEAD